MEQSWAAAAGEHHAEEVDDVELLRAVMAMEHGTGTCDSDGELSDSELLSAVVTAEKSC